MKKISVLLLLAMLPQTSYSSLGELSNYTRGSVTIILTNQKDQQESLHLTSANCFKDPIAIPSILNTIKLTVPAHSTQSYTFTKESRVGNTFYLENCQIIQPHQNISALLFATLTPGDRLKFHSPQNRLIIR